MTAVLLQAGAVAKYVQQCRCLRSLALQAALRQLPDKRLPWAGGAGRQANVLDPCLQQAGRVWEGVFEGQLQQHGFQALGAGPCSSGQHTQLSTWLQQVTDALLAGNQQCHYVAQMEFMTPSTAAHGSVGIHGIADFLLLFWRAGRPVLRVVECKCSPAAHMSHQASITSLQRLMAADMWPFN